MIAITWNTGMRISEIAKLNWLDVREDFLIVREGKGGKARTIFFGKKTKKLFKSCRNFGDSQYKNVLDGPVFWGRQGRLSTAQIHRRSKKWFKKLYFPKDITFHSLRHGYATRMIEEGVSLPLLRDQLGHSSISITSVYLHYTKAARKVLCQAT